MESKEESSISVLRNTWRSAKEEEFENLPFRNVAPSLKELSKEEQDSKNKKKQTEIEHSTKNALLLKWNPPMQLFVGLAFYDNQRNCNGKIASIKKDGDGNEISYCCELGDDKEVVDYSLSEAKQRIQEGPEVTL